MATLCAAWVEINGVIWTCWEKPGHVGEHIGHGTRHDPVRHAGGLVSFRIQQVDGEYRWPNTAVK